MGAQPRESLERKLLGALFHDRGAWSKIRDKLDDKWFEASPYARKLLELTDEFYAKDAEARRVDAEVLIQQIELRLNPKHREIASTLVREIAAGSYSAENIVSLVYEIKRRHVGAVLANALLNAGEVPDTKIAEYLDEYQSLAPDTEEDEGDDSFNDVSVADILHRTMNRESLIKLAPKTLNEYIDGGALRGHHVVIMARPETGKTAFAVTLIFSCILQGLKVVYFGNEDPISQVIQRAMCCVTGMSKWQLEQDPEKADALLKKRGWGNAIFVPLNPGTPREIDQWMEKTAADVGIVDQLRNIHVKADSQVVQLETAGKAVRQIGQRRDALMISFTQAGISAAGKLVLDMGDVADSKTGLPAQADLMIGMGMNAEYEQTGMRMFSLPKNKLSGKHVHFPVRLRADISRIESA